MCVRDESHVPLGILLTGLSLSVWRVHAFAQNPVT